MHRELRVVDDCPFMHALAGSTPAEVVAMTRELTEVVIRDDDTGLIAEVTSMLFDRSINIEDLDQAVREGVFRMTMRVDTSEMIVKGETLRENGRERERRDDRRRSQSRSKRLTGQTGDTVGCSPRYRRDGRVAHPRAVPGLRSGHTGAGRGITLEVSPGTGGRHGSASKYRSWWRRQPGLNDPSQSGQVSSQSRYVRTEKVVPQRPQMTAGSSNAPLGTRSES